MNVLGWAASFFQAGGPFMFLILGVGVVASAVAFERLLVINSAARVRTDKLSVTQAAAQFGFSRPTFYEARANFEQQGVAGLVPKKLMRSSCANFHNVLTSG